MSRRPLTRILVAGLLVSALLGSFALPSSAQVDTSVVDAIVAEADSIEGLSPLDPVLNEVSNLILTLQDLIDDLLADVPLVNTLALGGDDAVDAGVAFSQATYPDGAGTAVLSREDLFADGFSSGAFQGVNNAPLLFTGSDDLDPRTGMELQRLGMTGVTILGGETALHPLVVQKLEIAGLDVTRVGGPTRVETAVEAAAATSAAATTAVIARAYPDAGMDDSQAFADLLAAGPYAAENGWPMLLTTSDRLHHAVAAYLADSAVTDVVIVGGDKAVSQAVADELAAMGITVQRIAGANRYGTAVAIANARGFESSADADRIIVAESASRPDVWAPGFAATAHGSENSAPVLLTDGALVPAETLEFILAGVVDNLLDGGAAVVCASFVNPVACQAIGLLMVGNLSDAIDLLLLTLEDLPFIGEILAGLGLNDLLPAAMQSVYDQLVAAGADPSAIQDALSGLASGDATAIEGVIGDVAEEAEVPVDDVVGGIVDDLGGLPDLGGLGGLGG